MPIPSGPPPAPDLIIAPAGLHATLSSSAKPLSTSGPAFRRVLGEPAQPGYDSRKRYRLPRLVSGSSRSAQPDDPPPVRHSLSGWNYPVKQQRRHGGVHRGDKRNTERRLRVQNTTFYRNTPWPADWRDATATVREETLNVPALFGQYHAFCIRIRIRIRIRKFLKRKIQRDQRVFRRGTAKDDGCNPKESHTKM